MSNPSTPPGSRPPSHRSLRPSTHGGAFLTTRWSLVMRAGGGERDSAEALEKLCRAYWPPVYAWIRRQGHDKPTAEDLTQDFFASLLGYGSIGKAAPEKGRFRSYLLGSVKHFLHNEWEKGQAQKRGGGKAPFSLDALETYEREAVEPRDEASPDSLFDRRWAETLLAQANQRLRGDYEAAGQADRFEKLKGYLLGGRSGVSYAETAAALGLSEAAVKSAIFKLRQRYGEILRYEVAQTVQDPSEVEDELRCLLAALMA